MEVLVFNQNNKKDAVEKEAQILFSFIFHA